MNLNKKIRKFTGDGIRGYNEAINELVDATNWLSGIRVINGKPITESDQGPVIDLSQVNSTQNQQPWAVDPDGHSAGWVLMTMINTQNGQFYDAWVWAGPSKNLRPVPWLTDPSGIIADWVVCADNTFWGTGGCPAGIGNFQQIGFSANGPASTTNPYILTGNVPNPPIIPPANPPAFYLIADSAENELAGLPRQPVLRIVMAVGTGNPPVSITYTWDIKYDGTSIFSISGSETSSGADIFVLIDSTDWIYDPGGLPGYSQGSKKWIWQYQGSISTNTNPTIVETFTYSVSSPGTFAGILLWNATVLTK